MKKKIHKFKPSKKLGQNFLINKNIIDLIIRKIDPKLDEVFLEIGPGLGSLTFPILDLINKLYAIEIDNSLSKKLKEKVSSEKLTVFSENVIRFDMQKFYEKKKVPIRIFGNLPYNISVFLMLKLLKFHRIIKDMHFMFQKEVANRIKANPNTKNYGKLSVIVQYFFKVTSLIDVPKECFFPIPKVNSSFIRLEPHFFPPYYVSNIKLLSYITNMAFSKKRKMLRNSLSELFSEKKLRNLGINPLLRAENISISEYCCLTEDLVKKNFLIPK
ncbi:16S rRNA (adenine(1518)-N(6)/adenine(1519)-N(6))-dimethyltransferase RsmA [Buchnera aphidicola (Mindarus keteleerifoliae)]|uniref:16S rRNA (adenine(1518)-N(6)/adenine(1519)-N(6))- dimethyltransferase RsmA n=1 Tax=Buchnera aphidicola TaxID=9 RepID=UPI0031B6E33C